MRLRRDIYEPGDSREVDQSIEKFLGRKRSIQPFLAKLGIGADKKTKAAAGPAQEGR
jgi:Zn-dependent oligopeptidase